MQPYASSFVLITHLEWSGIADAGFWTAIQVQLLRSVSSSISTRLARLWRDLSSWWLSEWVAKVDVVAKKHLWLGQLLQLLSRKRPRRRGVFLMASAGQEYVL